MTLSRDPISAEVRAEVIARDGMTCQLCGCAVISGRDLYREAQIREPGSPYLPIMPAGHYKRMLTLDHIKPRSKGGTHDADNLRVACASCNSRRGPTYLRLERISLDEARQYVDLGADEHDLLVPLSVERDGIRVGVAVLEVDDQIGTLRIEVGPDTERDPEAVPRFLAASRQLLPILGYRGVVITIHVQGDAY